MAAYPRVEDVIAASSAPAPQKAVLTTLAATCADISDVVAGGALAGALGASGAVNVQDEEQKKAHQGHRHQAQHIHMKEIHPLLTGGQWEFPD